MENNFVIQVKNVSRSFAVPGGEFQALKGIYADIAKGSLTILKGRSGSGKTTLMNIIGTLDNPSAGEVWIDGRAVKGMSDKERENLRRRDMGFVFQAVSLIPTMNAFQNVEFSMRMAGIRAGRERDRRVEECLKLVGLGSRIHHMPAEMSGGEQQRVAIARAIAHSPKLILADEPTGNLDSVTSHDVLGLLKMAARQFSQTLILITHDRDIAQLADRIVHIEDGKIVGDTRKGSDSYA